MRIKYESCPLCDHPVSGEVDLEAHCAHHPLWVPGTGDLMKWVHCPRCRHVHVQSHLTSAGQAQVFKRMTKAHETDVTGLEQERFAAAALLDWVIDHVGPGLGRRWLDVGSGTGGLLLTLVEYGFRPAGVEVREGKERWNGIRIHRGNFPDGPESLYNPRELDSFDVVSMCDVLEHMIWPRVALVRARDLLSPRGYLVIATPNLDSPLWTLLGADNPYWSEVEHAHCFGRSRLEELLHELGFDTLAFTISRRYRLGMQLLARKR